MPPGKNINITLTANNAQLLSTLQQSAHAANAATQALQHLGNNTSVLAANANQFSRAGKSATSYTQALNNVKRHVVSLGKDIISLGGLLDAIPIRRAFVWDFAWDTVNRINAIPGQLTAALRQQIQETQALEGELYDLEAYLGGPGGQELIQFGREMGAMGSEENVKTAGLTILQNKILEIGQKSPFTAQEIAKATTAAAKAGVSLQEIAGDTGTALNAIALLSQNTGEALDESAKQVSKLQALFESSLSRTQKQFGQNIDTGKQYQIVVDGLATADMQSAASAGELTQALFNVGGSAGNLNLSFFETVSLVSAMVPAFESAASAGTSLKYVFSALTGGRSVKAQRAMKELGLMDEYGQTVFFDEKGFKGLDFMVLKLREVFGDASGIAVDVRNRIITDIFGQDALKAISRIVTMTDEQTTQMLETASTLTENARQGVQAAQSVADIKNEGLEFDIEYFRGSMDSLQKTLTMPLMKPMSNIVQTFSGLANAAFAVASSSRTATEDIEEARKEFIDTSMLPGAAALFNMVVKYSEKLGFALATINKEGFTFRSTAIAIASFLGMPAEGFSSKVIEIEKALRDLYTAFKDVMYNLPSLLTSFRDTIGWAFFGIIDAIRWLKENWDSVILAAKIFVAIWAVTKIVSFTMAIWEAIEAIKELSTVSKSTKSMPMLDTVIQYIKDMLGKLKTGGGAGGAGGIGGLFGLKDAVINFLKLLAKPLSAIQGLFTVIRTFAASAAAAVAPFITVVAIIAAAVIGFIVLYTKNIGGLADFTNKMFGDIWTYITNMFGRTPKIISNIFKTWETLFSSVWNAVSRFFSWIVNAFSNTVKYVIEAYNNWEIENTSFVQGFVDIFKGLVSIVGGAIKIVVGLIGFLLSTVAWALGGGIEASRSMAESVKIMVTGIFDLFRGAIYALTGLFKAAIGLFVSLYNSAIGIYNKIPGVNPGELLGEGVNDTINSYIQDPAINWLNNTEKWANGGVNIGEAMLNGWVKSLWDGKKSYVDANEELAQAGIDATNKTLGIESPSKVYYDIGVAIAQGLINGITDNADKWSNALIETFGSSAIDKEKIATAYSNISDEYNQLFAAKVNQLKQSNIGLSDEEIDARAKNYLETYFADRISKASQALTTGFVPLQELKAKERASKTNDARQSSMFADLKRLDFTNPNSINYSKPIADFLQTTATNSANKKLFEMQNPNIARYGIDNFKTDTSVYKYIPGLGVVNTKAYDKAIKIADAGVQLQAVKESMIPAYHTPIAEYTTPFTTKTNKASLITSDALFDNREYSDYMKANNRYAKEMTVTVSALTKINKQGKEVANATWAIVGSVERDVKDLSYDINKAKREKAIQDIYDRVGPSIQKAWQEVQTVEAQKGKDSEEYDVAFRYFQYELQQRDREIESAKKRYAPEFKTVGKETIPVYDWVSKSNSAATGVTSNVAERVLTPQEVNVKNVDQPYVPVLQVPISATFDDISNLHQFSTDNLDVAKLAKGFQITYGERGIAQRGLTSIMKDPSLASTYSQIGTRASTFLSLKQGKLTAEDAKTFQNLLELDRKDKETFLDDVKQLQVDLLSIASDTSLTTEQKTQKTMDLLSNMDKKFAGLTQAFTDVYNVKVGSFKDYQNGLSNVGAYSQYTDIAMGAFGQAISTAVLPENQSDAFKMLSPEAQSALIDSVKEMPLQAMAFLGDAMMDGVLSQDEFTLFETYVGEDVKTIREVLASGAVPTIADIQKAYTPFLDGTATFVRREDITGVIADSFLMGWDNVIAQKMKESGQIALKNFVLGFNDATGEYGQSINLTSILQADPAIVQNTGKEIGKNIAEGVAVGISDNSGTIGDTLGGSLDEDSDVVETAEKSIEKGSPSRLYARVIGLPIVQGVAKGIIDNGYLVSEALSDVLFGAKNVYSTSAMTPDGIPPEVWKNPGIFNGIINNSQDVNGQANGEFYTFGQELGSSIVNGMFGVETGTMSMSGQFLSMLKTEFNPASPMPQTLLAISHFRIFGGAMGKAFVNGFGNLLSGMSGDSSTSLSSMLDLSLDNIKTRYVNAFNMLGVALINGVIAGVNSKRSALDAAISGLIQSAKQAGETTAEVNSPSLLFSRALGSPISEGIAMGISSSGYMVSDAVSNVVNSASRVSFQPDISSTALNAQRANAANISNTTTNNYNLGVQTSQNPQLVSRSFAVMQSFKGE